MLIPERQLLDWYRNGIFPMGNPESGDIDLYFPDPRGIIDPSEFHIPDSLAKTIRSGRFEIRIDTVFERVMRLCAARPETWITEDIVQSYLNLHRRGHAHSVEAWSEGALAGGLYGVSMKGAFFGESMFYEKRDASKAALAALVERMKERGMVLLDVQYTTPHSTRFGAIEIPREEYLKFLRNSLVLNVTFSS